MLFRLPFPCKEKSAPKAQKGNKIVRPINVLLDIASIKDVWEEANNCLSDFLNSNIEINRIEKRLKTKLVLPRVNSRSL